MAFNDLFRFGAHAIIFDQEDRVLLVKKTYGDKGWSLPGGAVEPGETIHQGLLRECQEELGVVVEDSLLTGIYYHSSVNTQAGIFRCTIPHDADIQLSEEHSDYKWFPISELKETHRVRAMDAKAYAGGQIASRAF